MRVLGIDTATSCASVTLIDNGEVLADERYPRTSSSFPNSSQPRSCHAAVLLSLIESVLRRSGRALGEIEGMAVSIGPGSFTGLRIGLSTVKGLAYGWNCPVGGISTLEANAARAADFDGVICSVLDARRNEVYAAFYRCHAGAFFRLTEDTVAPISTVKCWARELSDGTSCLFIGDGVAMYETELAAGFESGIRLSRGDEYGSLGAAVARLGERRLRSSGGDSLASLAPAYVRLPEAESKRRELAKYLKNREEPTLTKMGS